MITTTLRNAVETEIAMNEIVEIVPAVSEETYQLYKTDDFEIYISRTGKITASQSAIARMLGMQQGHLSSVLKRAINAGEILAPETATVTLDTRKGNSAIVSLYGVDTIRKMAVKYNPALAEKFSEMGATVYLYQLAGYKVAPQQPKREQPDPFKTTTTEYNDHLQTAHEALGKLLNLHRFAEDKPGLENYLRLAEAMESKALSGKMTLDEMAETFGIELTPEYSRVIGRAMAGVSRSQEEAEPTKIRKRTKDSSGNHQSYMVSEYSIDYLSLFESLCRAYKLI